MALLPVSIGLDVAAELGGVRHGLVPCPANNYAISLRLFALGGVATPRNSGAITRRRALPATKTRERNSVLIYGTGH
jgi:hypothetical protein